ncbi:MAG: substrate-binding domain-containing protein [Acidimicrobiales bacterium]|nr:substrate-binding domain-containing protein [Acidimicrobiales bacterium]
MLKRFVAFAVAAGLVAGAFALRDRVRDGDDTGGDTTERVLRLTCSPEVADACEAIAADHDEVAVTVEPAGVTAARLTASDVDALDPGLDGWLVPAPWPQQVDEARARAGSAPLFADDGGPPLARSPLVLAVWDDRAEVLAPACGGEITWRCLGDVGGQRWADLGGPTTWGPVKPGHDPPDTSATGLVVLGQAVTSYAGRADVSAADFQDDAFRAWLARLEDAVPTFSPAAGSAFEQLLVVGPAAFDAVGTTEAQAVPLLERSPARSSALTLLYPSPVATADVVLGLPAGRRPAERLASLVRGPDGAAALAASGWRVDGQPAAPGIPDQPPLPADDGLPSAGALAALRQLWQEVVR